MAVREIRLYGDPVLRTVADPITEFDQSVLDLSQDLLDTVDVPGRAGVAAPQIGIPLRAFSYNSTGQRGVVINPTLVATEGEQVDDEGCLSVPGLWYSNRRAKYAKVTGFDEHGKEITVEGEGELARCLQHEVDHLNGIVYVHRLAPPERRAAMRAIRRTAWFNG